MTNMGYRFTDYPPDCPPLPHDGNDGVYYRIVKNPDCADPSHFKSHCELGIMHQRGKKDPCGWRGVSLCAKKEHAQSVLDALPEKGEYIAILELNGNHGVVHGYTNVDKSHYNWWIPEGVDRNAFCKRIEGPFR